MKGSEQRAVSSEQRGKLIVLPRVWAVAEKKPCASESSMVQARAFGTRNANTGVSPLRSFAAPVEMTNVKKIGLPPSVEMTDVVDKHSRLNMSFAQPVEVAFYRKYTEAMLRRYAAMSMASGRVPSMLGREMFRGNVTNYRVSGFDDAVIFCHDVEACLKRLSSEEQKLIKRIGVQGYTHGEAAVMFGICLRTCVTQYASALDKLTRRFLEVKILEPLKACQ